MVVAFVTCFLFGGFTGLILANATVDLAYHDSYFVVGHFHYVLSIAAAIGATIFFLSFFRELSGLGFMFLKITSFALIAVFAVNVLFGILHLVGIEGHPRRVFLSAEVFVASNSFANISLVPLIASFSLSSTSVRKSSSTGFLHPFPLVK